MMLMLLVQPQKDLSLGPHGGVGGGRGERKGERESVRALLK